MEKIFLTSVLNFIGKLLKKFKAPSGIVSHIFSLKDSLVFAEIGKYVLDGNGKESNINILGEKKTPENSFIWTGWLQGMDNAPNLVKACVRNIDEMSGDHRLIFITEDNLFEYLPDFSYTIYEKYLVNKIKPAHFMDLIRVALLVKYGGLWIDPTVWITQELDDCLFERDFVSYKGIPGNWHSNPADSMWCSFFMGGKSNSFFLSEVLEILLNYWEKNDKAIDYFLLDYVMRFVYDNYKSASVAVDTIARSDVNLFNLDAMLREPVSEKNIKAVRQELTKSYLFKLSYKGKKNGNSLYTYYLKDIN